MEDYTRRDSLSASDVTDKRKSPTPGGEKSERVSETPSRSVSPNVAPLQSKEMEKTSSEPAEKPDSKPIESSRQRMFPNQKLQRKRLRQQDKKETQSQNLTSVAASGDTSQSDRSRASSRASRSSARSRSSSPAVRNAQKPEQPKNALPILVTTSIENQSDKEAAKEPTVDVVIPLNVLKRNRSRSVSPGRKSHHRHVKENTPQLLSVGSKSHHTSARMRRSASPTADPSPSDNASSNGEEETRKGRRKRRDPTRTLENLKEKLASEKQAEDGQDGEEKGGNVVFHSQRRKECPDLWEESSDGDWTEAEDEADYESDEYSISQTFSLKDCLPMGDLYPLSRSSSRCSAFVSDYDSDTSMPLFMLPSRAEESRGRVDRLFAVPPPSFSCSITYDGQESWDDESLHSCTDFDDEYCGRLSRYSRAESSALGGILSSKATHPMSLYEVPTNKRRHDNFL
ncbi:hypothetical protein OSTOST_14926, partial [Ostertagia ostertagi]